MGQASDHSPLRTLAGLYAFLIDVAGEDEGAAAVIADLEKDRLRNPARNATALTSRQKTGAPIGQTEEWNTSQDQGRDWKIGRLEDWKHAFHSPGLPIS